MIRIHALCKSFGALQVLDRISAELAPSSVTAILGPSGCGKTTLLNIAAGLLAADSGHIEGLESESFSYAFQEARLLPWLSARENILFALSGLAATKLRVGDATKLRVGDATKLSVGDATKLRVGEVLAARADRYLRAAGLADFGRSRPTELSGGMRMRLSLARAFAYPSTMLLLDEAFSSVDLKIRLGLMDLFSQLWEEERRTTIIVTHDIQEVAYLADRVFVLSERPARIIADIPFHKARGERRFGSPEEQEAEAQLYDLILRPRDRHC